MGRTVEAIVDDHGSVRLLEAVDIPAPRRALVTIVEKERVVQVSEIALLSNRHGPDDWNRPEERRGVLVPAAGAVVLVPFPFSDLSQTK